MYHVSRGAPKTRFRTECLKNEQGGIAATKLVNILFSLLNIEGTIHVTADDPEFDTIFISITGFKYNSVHENIRKHPSSVS